MSAHRLLGKATIGALLLLATSNANAADITGEGTWQSLRSKAIGGAWKVSLFTSGEDVTGQISLEGSNVLSGGVVHGTLDGSSIVLGVMTDGVLQATFKGALKGKEVNGEWECDALQDHGVWYGTLAE